MKKLIDSCMAFVAVVFMLAVVACGTAPPGSSPLGLAAPQTFNDQLAIAERGVQLAQTSATAALRAGKISVAQDRLLQKQIGLVHEGLLLARSMKTSDPDKASAQLTAALKQLASMQQQTGVDAP